MLELINVMFPIMFIIVVGIIIFSLVRGIITWNKNNQSPRLTVSVLRDPEQSRRLEPE